MWWTRRRLTRVTRPPPLPRGERARSPSTSSSSKILCSALGWPGEGQKHERGAGADRVGSALDNRQGIRTNKKGPQIGLPVVDFGSDEADHVLVGLRQEGRFLPSCCSTVTARPC